MVGILLECPTTTNTIEFHEIENILNYWKKCVCPFVRFAETLVSK